jgi:hypothetical protein
MSDLTSERAYCIVYIAMSIEIKDRAYRARLRREETAKRGLSVKVDRDVFEILDQAARELGLSRGAIVERALDFYFKVALLAPERLPKAWLS